jgi:hypothetical protein
MRHAPTPGTRALFWFGCYATSLLLGSRWPLDERGPQTDLVHLILRVPCRRLRIPLHHLFVFNSGSASVRTGPSSDFCGQSDSVVVFLDPTPSCLTVLLTVHCTDILSCCRKHLCNWLGNLNILLYFI